MMRRPSPYAFLIFRSNRRSKHAISLKSEFCENRPSRPRYTQANESDSLTSLKPDIARECNPTKVNMKASLKSEFLENQPIRPSYRRAHETNSLAKMKPDIAREFHPTKNSGLKAIDIAAGSGLQIWWRCLVNPEHEWETTPHSRTGT
eukprot:470859_1